MLSAMLLCLLPLAAAVRQRRAADRTFSPGVFLTSMLCVGIIVPMLGVLHFFNGLTGSYGLAIILLTLVIKAITWPL